MIEIEQTLAGYLRSELNILDNIFYGESEPGVDEYFTVVIESVATPVSPSLIRYEVSLKGRFKEREKAFRVMLSLRNAIPFYNYHEIKAVISKQMAQIYSSTRKGKTFWNVSSRVLLMTC